MNGLAHDKIAAREQVGNGKLPVLVFSGGDKKVLFPSGQMIGIDRLGKLPEKVSGKTRRRERIAARRLEKSFPTGLIAAP